jgi:Tol biopolymer transport system component
VQQTRSDPAPTPIFAPDGRTLVRTPLRSYDSGDLQIAPAVGGPLRTLLRGPVPGTTVMPASARWSADGRLVYFLGIDRQGRSSFWSIPAAGGAPTLIVSFDDPTRESNRSESTTDGARLYFHARAEGRRCLGDGDRPTVSALGRREREASAISTARSRSVRSLRPWGWPSASG